MSPLEKVPGAVSSPVYPSRVAEGYVLHYLRQRHFSYLYCKVNMIRHEAEGMNAVPESLNPFLQEEIESVSVFILEENVMTCIPTDNNVV